MLDRAHQCLVKQALEPEWESKFEANSYGFRPGRSCHDAMAAIYTIVNKQAKYVLDADLKGCFDNINHEALLRKLNTYPALRHTIRAWLKAGVVNNGTFEETPSGTPQGGVCSPLLANIALHGMETVLTGLYPTRQPLHLVRYADDFVVLHATLEGVTKAQAILETWLKDIGLEMKPSKTRIVHLLEPLNNEAPGFDFLSFNIRQYPVGKHRSGKLSNGKLLGFKTIITPSKEAVKRHTEELGKVIRTHHQVAQGQLIKELNPKIRGWTNYHRTVASARTFQTCNRILFRQLYRWACRRHPNKGKRWVNEKYWHVEEGNEWKFAAGEVPLWLHTETKIQRHTKVKGTASPYDGNMLYWSKRLGKHPLLSGTKGRLLQKQQGKCRWCGLHFRDGDLVEVDHITPKNEGGGEELSNKFALHRHCHDARHAKRIAGAYVKGSVVEEPDAGKARTSGSEAERRG